MKNTKNKLHLIHHNKGEALAYLNHTIKLDVRKIYLNRSHTVGRIIPTVILMASDPLE